MFPFPLKFYTRQGMRCRKVVCTDRYHKGAIGNVRIPFIPAHTVRDNPTFFRSCRDDHTSGAHTKSVSPSTCPHILISQLIIRRSDMRMLLDSVLGLIDKRLRMFNTSVSYTHLTLPTKRIV